MVENKKRGAGLAFLGSLMFGISPIFVKLVLDYVNIETMNVLFSVFATLCFLLLFFAFRRGHFKDIAEYWPKFALIGFFSALGSLLYAFGILISGPTSAAFLIQFTAVFTIIFGVVILKERFSKFEAIGISLSIIGVFILAFGNISIEAPATMAVLGASVLFASANLASKVYVRNINSLSLAGGNSIFMFLFILLLAIFFGKVETVFPPNTILYGFLGGLTGLVLSFIFFFKALEFFEVSKAATVRTIEPFLTAIFSFLILSIVPTLNEFIGGSIIVAGIMTLSLAKGKNKK